MTSVRLAEMPTPEVQNAGDIFSGTGTFIVSTDTVLTSPHVIIISYVPYYNTIMREISVKYGRAGDQAKMHKSLAKCRRVSISRLVKRTARQYEVGLSKHEIDIRK